MSSADAVAATAVTVLDLGATAIGIARGGRPSVRRTAFAIAIAFALLPALLVYPLLTGRWTAWAIALAGVFALLAGQRMVAAARTPARVLALLTRSPELKARAARLATAIPGAEPLRVFVGPVRHLAAVADTVDPVVVLATRAVARLEADELDCLLAHEIAHTVVAGRWVLRAVPALAAAGGMAAAAFVGPLPATAIATTWSAVLLRRVFGRPTEVACDRAAAAALGAETAARAFARLRCLATPGLRWTLAFGTHPDFPQRIASFDGESRAATVARRLGRAGLGTMAVGGVAGIVLAASRPIEGTILIFGFSAIPVLVPLLELRADPHRAIATPAARVEQGSAVLSAAALTAFVIGVLLHNTALSCLAFFSLFAVSMRARDGIRRLRKQKMGVGASSLAEQASAPGMDPWIRYSWAVARLAAGHSEGADELERLGDAGRVAAAEWLLATDLERALENARKVAENHPRLGAGHALGAWALLELGRLHDAEQSAARALEIEPSAGAAVAALVAVRRGDLELARTRLAFARETDPGSAPSRLAEAELRFASGHAAESATALARARAVLRSAPAGGWITPFLERLEARLAEATTDPVPGAQAR